MTTDEPYATRRELDALANQLRRLDEHGTRGVGVLQVQLTTQLHAIAKLEGAIEAHERAHTADEARRITSRRWLATTLIALFIALEGPLAYVVIHVR